MPVLCIHIEDGDPADSANYVKHVGSLLEEGFTSGHTSVDFYWSIEEDPS